MGHRQWKIRWCYEMELLSFNPSNVPGDTHQITSEPSVHSHTDRGERTQPRPPVPPLLPPMPPFSPPPLLSLPVSLSHSLHFSSPFLPLLMLHARRRSKSRGQTIAPWMRAHSVSRPPLFSHEVAQFMFALCLPPLSSPLP
ncbi:unnamed protein product [Arctogadus glacialis]